MIFVFMITTFKLKYAVSKKSITKILNSLFVIDLKKVICIRVYKKIDLYLEIIQGP